MKGPQNFAKKIQGFKFESHSKWYCLRDSFGRDDRLWLESTDVTKHIIYMEFNWENESYKTMVAKRGCGKNFHTILPSVDFNRKHFLSFNSFNSWMIAKVEDFQKHFNHT